MKTLQELYNEVIASEELKKEYFQAVSDKKVGTFMKAHGCEATAEEFKTFLVEQSQKTADKELSVEELENVAGGGCNGVTKRETYISIFSAGIGCAIISIESAVTGHAGQKTDSEGRLCSELDADDYDIARDVAEGLEDIIDWMG